MHTDTHTPSPRQSFGPASIYFVRTRDAAGKDCYFFLLCSEIKKRLLEDALINDRVDLTRYGAVIASGFGHEPSKDVIEMLREQYQYEHEVP